MSRRASTSSSPRVRTPSVFAGHASPLLLDDPAWCAELLHWGREMARPKSIAVLSAHWFEERVTLGTLRPLPLIYDFNNHPARHYELAYPAPTAPALAARVRELVGQVAPMADAPDRGLDHGAYVPLLAIYPEADIPVLQVSLPKCDPLGMIELGRALAPLRDEGTLLVASGAITHNLALLDYPRR